MRNQSVGYDYIVQNGLEQLAVNRYIVETDYDEVGQYKSVVFILKTMMKKKKGLKIYTILPTTGCNARCIYCYEEGYKVSTMTPETADRLVDYICETRQNDTVRLRWFGGEPLAAVNIIRQICSALQDRGVPYQSDLITNASLMTKELAHEAKELWHLERVQISLDGAKSDYEERKNYYSPEKYNYDVVMNAIQYLADEGFNVTLRVNFDKGNLSGMEPFIDEIAARFSPYDNVKMYLSMLFQQQHREDCVETYIKMFGFYSRYSEYKILKELSIRDNFKINNCLADTPDDSVVIAPDGKLHRCEHLPGNDEPWGSIYDGATDQERFFEKAQEPRTDEKCCSCCFLPLCTSFYRSSCPNWFEKCYEYNCLLTEHTLRALLKGVPETDDDNE